MKRATVLGIVLAAPMRAVPATAQPAAGKTYRVGILFNGSRSTSSAYDEDALLRSFVRSLAGVGYREGQNLELVVRSTSGNYSRADALAKELVAAKPDVIIASTGPIVAALKRATASVPIVMTDVPNPVGSGYVASLARPDGNITGVTSITGALAGKRLQLLMELVPKLGHVAFLVNPNNPGTPDQVRQFHTACRQLGIDGVTADIRAAGEIDSILQGLPRKHADALVVETDAMLTTYGRRIINLVAAQHLPAIYGERALPAAGGLVSYGASRQAQWVLAATYVDRILKGAKPADLPVQQPTTFDLVVNLKAAREIGLTVPQSILLQATQVIR